MIASIPVVKCLPFTYMEVPAEVGPESAESTKVPYACESMRFPVSGEHADIGEEVLHVAIPRLDSGQALVGGKSPPPRPPELPRQ